MMMKNQDDDEEATRWSSAASEPQTASQGTTDVTPRHRSSVSGVGRTRELRLTSVNLQTLLIKFSSRVSKAAPEFCARVLSACFLLLFCVQRDL
ncbi:hypothetical protein EYF80_029081 [Liparis tanakae]|uniref:Uncharacterized protein n=1 Tax=Liparis tanakae TaxID=230148 RepID=A0A4Z2H4E6_9TELE|nr:hypothetical protein EYF80_029081 [Liparis tanakae]